MTNVTLVTGGIAVLDGTKVIGIDGIDHAPLIGTEIEDAVGVVITVGTIGGKNTMVSTSRSSYETFQY